MELVISIVSWNTRELLEQCLRSLEKHCRPDHTRIVVVDNASSDGTPEMVRREFPSVTLLESGGNLGFGKAHNLVVAHSTEPFVLFLNPDTEFVENAHEKMLDVFRRHEDVGLVGCRMINLDGSVQPLGWQWHTSPWTELVSGLFVSRATGRIAQRLLPYHDPLKDGFVRKLYGGALMARCEVLDQVGLFDERFFMYGEDVDLSRRVEAAGHRLYYLARTRIIHVCGGASAQAPGRFATLMMCESICRLMEKYYGSTGRIFFLAGLLLQSCLRISVLGIMQLGRVLAFRPRSEALRFSMEKQAAMLKWCFGLARPAIPS